MEHVFISYVREDAAMVDQLVSVLSSHGIKAWIDRNELQAGVRWSQAIRNAIREGTYFIACFSCNYKAKTRSYMNEELTTAIEEIRLRSTDRKWFLPVLLDDSTIPDIEIRRGEWLDSFQYISLHPDWDNGLKQLLAVFDFCLGERVKAKWDLYDDTYYDGTISEKPKDWVFVNFDDGSRDFIPKSWVQKGELDVGSSVDAKWWDDDVYTGVIADPPNDFEYIKFDKGDEAFVQRKHIMRA